jgi:hypothetical protein
MIRHHHTEPGLAAIIDQLDDPDALIGVTAAELLKWGWLAAGLAQWLTCPTHQVAADHATHHPHGPTLTQQAWMLAHISNRIGALLDGDQR